MKRGNALLLVVCPPGHPGLLFAFPCLDVWHCRETGPVKDDFRAATREPKRMAMWVNPTTTLVKNAFFGT
jgi:hypothetical protein